MNIAILGYGVVGSGVDHIITTKGQNKHHVTKIWSRPNPKKQIPHLVSTIKEIINDESIDCVVETLNGIEPAHEHILACLNAGKHVISANKAVIAKYYEEFQAAAKKNDVQFKFEASVGGGIPWLKELGRAKRIDTITSCSGILNGTSNYILSTMMKEQADFEAVLKDAQALGFAEANPSADIDGFDVLNKIMITANVGFNGRVQAEDFLVCSMRPVTATDIQYFKNKGYTLKYLGQVEAENQRYEGSVMINACLEDSLEANTNQNYNCATLQGDTIGTLTFYGQGAGQLPTAHAIVQDLLDLESDRPQEFQGLQEFTFNAKTKTKFWIRTNQQLPEKFIAGQDGQYRQLIPMNLKEFKENFLPLLKKEDLVVRMPL